MDASFQRLKNIREELGYSQSEFSKALDIPQPYLSAVESGKKAITFKLSKSLKDRFKVSVDWLIDGDGEMFIANNKKTESNPSFLPSLSVNVAEILNNKDSKKIDLNFTLSIEMGNNNFPE